MWSVVASKHLFEGSAEYDFGVKPLFDLALYLNFKFAQLLGVHPMVTARGAFALNFVFCESLFYLTARRIGCNRPFALLVSMLVAGNSFVIKRFGHVRSDELVTTLVLGLTYIRMSPGWDPSPIVRRIALFMFFATAAILITPKAGLFFLAWLVTVGREDLRESWKARRGFWLAVLAAVTTGAIYIGTHLSALDFLTSSLTQEAPTRYFDPIQFQHAQWLLLENPLLLVILLLNLGRGYLRRNHGLETRFLDFANLYFLIGLLYPDRLPFFLASLVPVLCLPLLIGMRESVEFRFRRISVFLYGVLYLTSLTSLLGWSYVAHVGHNNKEQLAALQWLEQFEPDLAQLKVYDQLGFRPFANSQNWFTGPGESSNASILQRIETEVPDVIFLNRRLLLLGPPFLKFLANNYWTDEQGIFVRRFELPMFGKSLLCSDVSRFLIQHYPKIKWGRRQHTFLMARDAAGKALNLKAPESNESGSLKDCYDYALPETTSKVYIVPFVMVSPPGQDLIQLFRFDPEY